jgi:hypothetical protein
MCSIVMGCLSVMRFMLPRPADFAAQAQVAIGVSLSLISASYNWKL